MPYKTRDCTACGKPVEPYASRQQKCSAACGLKVKPSIRKTCTACGTVFGSKRRVRYCSPGCRKRERERKNPEARVRYLDRIARFFRSWAA